jgi:CheY-like chemotaxis protein
MKPECFSSAQQALDWLKTEPDVRLALLDYQMPGMDGAQLAAGIHSVEKFKALPLILLSSSHLGGTRGSLSLNDFAYRLLKPIKQLDLFNAIVSALGAVPQEAKKLPPEKIFDPTLATRYPFKILVAEDNVVNQKVAVRMFEQLGYRVDVAGNGAEAVAAVERQGYDLVFMDVQMPIMDGLEATRQIRTRASIQNKPFIIAMTANAMKEDREACMAAGMDDFVSKPVRAENLKEALIRCAESRFPVSSPADSAVAGANEHPETNQAARAHRNSVALIN